MESGTPPVGPPLDNALLHVMLALAAVVALGQLLGWLFRYLGQPPVIGEVVAGISLGPSLLGWVAPSVSAWLLPPGVAPFLGMIAQLGVVLYMFLVGLELDVAVLRQRARLTLAAANASIVVPFLLGALLALALYPQLAGAGVSFTSFALFLGIALAITAFPVLARILTDRQLQRTRIGVLALGCAATADVTAWCLLAVVVGVVQARPGDAALTIGWTAAYLGFMLLLVRPCVIRCVARWDSVPLTPRGVALVLVAVLLSALATESIGIHAIFGAFLLGALIPHDSALAGALTHKLEDLVTVLLLPAFFAYTGMRTRIDLVSGWALWLTCGAIVLAATVGKLGGTLAAARCCGLGWREATALGVLMNTRGLMELIVLNVGLDLGVITPTLFALMVIMALATNSMATGPALALLMPPAELEPGSVAIDGASSECPLEEAHAKPQA